jgi:hypothetical protein
MKSIEKTLKFLVVIILMVGFLTSCVARKCGCPNKQGMIGYK